jgi:uncharacterized membrane protein
MSGLFQHWLDLLRVKPHAPDLPVDPEVKEHLKGQLREAAQLNASSARKVARVAADNTKAAQDTAGIVQELLKARDIIETARASLELIAGGKQHEGP